MNNNEIMYNNKSYWNANADFWFGTTALPEYGVKFPTEDELHLFGESTYQKSNYLTQNSFLQSPTITHT